MEQIFSLHHRGMDCIGVRLSREDSRNTQIRKIPGIKWSQTHKCWYAEFSEAVEQELINILEVSDSHKKQDENSGLVPPENDHPDPEYPGILPGKAEQKTRNFKNKNSSVPALPESHQQDLLKLKRYLEVQRFAANTIKNYVKAVELMLRYYSDHEWRKWTQSDIEIYFKTRIIDRKLSWSYQNTFVSALQKFFLVHQIDGKKIDLQKRPRRSKTLPKVLSQEDIGRLLGSLKNQKHRTMLSLIYGCGLRVGDLLNMRFSDIDPARGLINLKLGKGNKDRTVPISDKLIAVINEYYKIFKPHTWLFEGQVKGNRYSERSLQEVFKKALKASDLSEYFTTHCLRHSYATHLMEAGTSTRVIQEILGHKSSKTTEIYTHVSKTLLKRVKSPFDDLNI